MSVQKFANVVCRYNNKSTRKIQLIFQHIFNIKKLALSNVPLIFFILDPIPHDSTEL